MVSGPVGPDEFQTMKPTDVKFKIFEWNGATSAPTLLESVMGDADIQVEPAWFAPSRPI